MEEDAKSRKACDTFGESGIQHVEEKKQTRQEQVALGARRILQLQSEIQNLESKSIQIHADMMSEFARKWSLQMVLENRLSQKVVKSVKQNLKTELFELKRSWRFYLNEKVRQKRVQSEEKLKELHRERQQLLSSFPELARIFSWEPRQEQTSRNIQGDFSEEGKIPSKAGRAKNADFKKDKRVCKFTV